MSCGIAWKSLFRVVVACLDLWECPRIVMKQSSHMQVDCETHENCGEHSLLAECFREMAF